MTKGDEIEEWLDLRFFRPIGAQMARRLARTPITADQVTLVSLVIGLAAGHLFVYRSAWLNAAGFLLFIASDLFDSADGQLARLRRTSTRLGRMLDGMSDGARFVNLGVHLVVRLVVSGGWNPVGAVALLALAGVSHWSQSSAIDFVRHAFLALAVGKGSELGIEEDASAPGGSWLRRLASRVYRSYSRRQVRMFPRTTALLQSQGDHGLSPSGAAAYRARVGPIIPQCAWLGQNLRFLILGVTALAGWPAGLLWITVGPMNLVLLWLRRVQESGAARVLQTIVPSRTRPVTSPAIARGGE